MKKKLLACFLTLCMLLTFVPATAMAAEYADTEGHWAEEAIDRWSDYGVIQGNNGNFNPNGALTRAHMAAILCRLLNLPAAEDAGFKDVAPSDWHADYINRCAAAGIMLGNNGYANPNSPITRQQAIVMLARALGIQPIKNPDLSAYEDADQVASYAAGYVAAMAEAGIVKGTSATTLSVGATITRAATVTILHRAIDLYANEDNAVIDAKDVDGIILVVAEDVEIKNAPAGTIVVIPDEIGSVKINGKTVSDDQAYEVPAKAPVSSGSSSGGSFHSHSYSGTITTPATCTTAGVKTYTCGCGDSYTEVIPAGHNWNDGIVTSPADCYNSAEKTYTCGVCGETNRESVGNALGHNWDGGTVTTPATCTAFGVKTYSCQNGCGETYTEEIPMADHVWAEVEGSACVEKTYGCENCDATKSEGGTGHHLADAWTEAGDYHTKACSNPGCSYVEKAVHTYDAWASVSETQHQHACADCGKTEAAAHTYGAMELVDENTGKFTCSGCGHFYTEDYVARIGGTYYVVLADAITAANSTDVITLLENLTLTGDIFNGKTLTFDGQGEKTVVVSPGASASGTITFQNMNITGAEYPGNTYSNFYTTQLNGAAKVTYNNCVITGLITTYSAATEFVGCDIYTGGYYSIFVYTDDVTFTGCDIYADDDRWVKVYGEGDAENTTTFTACDFKFVDGYTGTDSMKPAINVDGSYRAYTVNITNCTVPEGVDLFGGTLNTNDKIYVNGKLYLADGLSLDEGTATYEISNANGLAAAAAYMAQGGKFEIMDDIDMTGKSWVPVTAGADFVLDGNDKTISNLTVETAGSSNGMDAFGFMAGASGDVEIKNLTFDEATITGNEAGNANGAVVMATTRQHSASVTKLTNVTVSNSTVEKCDRSGAFFAYGDSHATIQLDGCKAIGNTINSIGTAGALFAFNNYAVATIVEQCVVTGNTVFSSEGSNKAGMVIGTVSGEIEITNFTQSDNTATNAGVATNNIFGRFYGIASIDGDYYVGTMAGLNSAVAAVANNRTIVMVEGTYNAVLNVASTNGKTFTIKAAEDHDVVLAGIGHESNGTPSNVTFQDLTINNANTAGWFTGTAPNIAPCVGAWGGNLKFENCTFEVAGTSGKETGVMTWWTTGAMSLSFTECTFNGIDNHTSARAMQIYGNVNMTVENCKFNTNKDYTLKYVGAEETTATLIDNKVNNSENFVELGSSAYPGANYTVKINNSTLGAGVSNYVVANVEGQTVIIDNVTVYPAASQS